MRLLEQTQPMVRRLEAMNALAIKMRTFCSACAAVRDGRSSLISSKLLSLIARRPSAHTHAAAPAPTHGGGGASIRRRGGGCWRQRAAEAAGAEGGGGG